MGAKGSVERRRNIGQPTAAYDEHNYPHQQWSSSSSSSTSSYHHHHQRQRHRRHHHPPPPPPKGYYDSPAMAYPADSSSYYVPPAGFPPASNPPLANEATTTSYSRDRGKRAKFETKFSRITDDFTSLPQVTEALAKAGLESSNLIVGVDFTKSNEWTGKSSFQGRSLHHIGTTQNPYEHAISIIGRTLSAFDEDNLIPCFGFGDASTHDRDVFSFYPGERPCSGFEEALDRYREIAPKLRLAGPTSFAPIIEMAMNIVEQSGGQYHVLVIIADGQVTRSVDTANGRLSPQEQKTLDAIVKASEFPLSIILVGVGDGPWDMMREFDDNIPARSFDNFQFVNFTSIMSKNAPESQKETEFALAALMEIPLQYRATLDLGILGQHRGTSPRRVALPPPVDVSPAASSASLGSRSFESAYPDHNTTPTPTAPAENSSWGSQVCPVCLSSPRNMAFGCGHQICQDCGPLLTSCPICRSRIQTRIKLY